MTIVHPDGVIHDLFLTACSSQTWSGFSSIMMDDPVTHFDDLNTYALLDLTLDCRVLRKASGSSSSLLATRSCCSLHGTSSVTWGWPRGSTASKPLAPKGQ